MSSSSAPSASPTAPSGDTDISDSIMDEPDDQSSIQVLKLMGLEIPAITVFVETHPTMDMKDFLRTLRSVRNVDDPDPMISADFPYHFHLHQLSQHPDEWDADSDTEDLVNLARWLLVTDTNKGDTFAWHTTFNQPAFRHFREINLYWTCTL